MTKEDIKKALEICTKDEIRRKSRTLQDQTDSEIKNEENGNEN